MEADGTVIGSDYKTATSGRRVELNSTELEFYNVDGTEVGSVYGSGSASDLTMYLGLVGTNCQFLSPTIFEQTVEILGKITTYNNIVTEGNGVPAILDYVSADNQTASIGATNISSSTATGEYRVSFYLEEYTDAAVGSTVYATLHWEGVGGENRTESTVTINLGAGANGMTHKTFVVRHLGAGSVSLQYSTTYAGSTDAYMIRVITERLN